ncbi:MAG: hypothetical protein AAF941_07065 [Pseudomonadota bacterium]
MSSALALGLSNIACIPSADSPSPSPEPAPRMAQASTSEAVPTPAATQPTARPVPIVQEPVYEDYLDAPQSAGDWTYYKDPRETLAFFGTAPDSPILILRCDLDTKMIGIGRPGQYDGTAVMRISTETTTRVLEAEPVSSVNRLAAAQLPAGDPLFDAMAITKGRFAIEVEGAKTIYVPAWAEVTRVIEDCR